MSTSSLLGLDHSSQMSRSSSRSDWFTERDLHVAGYCMHTVCFTPYIERYYNYYYIDFTLSWTLSVAGNIFVLV